MYYEAKKETLLMLYRHTLLTAKQLALCLHYKPKTIYNLATEMKGKGLVRSVLLPFLKRNHVAYTLTAYGARAAAYLAGDETVYRAKSWENGPVQLEHYYGTNAFFTNLIRHSLSRTGEGLVEWLDPRAAAERYVQPKRSGKPVSRVKPDGFGIYLFPESGRLAFHLEYDTGTETIWRLKEKMAGYGRLLPTIWPQVQSVHVLFVSRIESRARAVIDVWDALRKGALASSRLPHVWAVHEREWEENGVGGTRWRGSEGQHVSLQAMPLLPLPPEQSLPLLGKQPREPSPIQRGEGT